MNIYVADQLKARMDVFEGRINWSALAQQAFAAEIERWKLSGSRDWLIVADKPPENPE